LEVNGAAIIDLAGVEVISPKHFLRGETIMLFEEALTLASRDEGFKATVYAMNTLLIHKSIYTQDEFQGWFVEWVKKGQKHR
jgi:hypothetical protein